MTLELINETKPLQTSVHLRKHQRSTTLVSQLSMGESMETASAHGQKFNEKK